MTFVFHLNTKSKGKLKINNLCNRNLILSQDFYFYSHKHKWKTFVINIQIGKNTPPEWILHFYPLQIRIKTFYLKENALCTKLFTKSMYKSTGCMSKSMTSRFYWNPVTIGLLAFHAIHKRSYLSTRLRTHRRFCHWIIGTERNSSFWRQPLACSIFDFSTLLQKKTGIKS